MTMFVLFVVSYLIGSISFSYLLTKVLRNEDIRNHGSGNAGATNTLRVLGKKPAIAVLLLDCLKGILVVLVALWFTNSSLIAVLCGLVAVIGHNYPVFYGFKGGKGVATAIGVFAAIAFLPSLIAGVIAIITIWISRFVSLGSIVFLILTPFFMLYQFNLSLEAVLASFVLSIVSIWKHRGNIARIWSGNESKI
ncbi:glycerol-3-phosphate 1-O-acyltransferase PlsY [Fictibacillus sp. 26RED30]|uniref:glycerol-3-phosphate 1-O-acyltransferase PlsY n=1 Tax=Fictibacillus sp. 26RED30 TaxID=2745877 RepID=UPI0018CE9DFD|nr:glycerol-3-phosphate 1-O-acyltransferase PlsY [Fictibacillus sp. 26RED30]MBH0160294.1 glycerol-3-phosphate 1-O-acyltransferase PlsY [Fictibacillus sp. 26RED30]